MNTKYPRTMHFPWSPGMSNDDKVIKHYKYLEGKEVVGTIKYDGENTTIKPEACHARSLDSAHHPSRDWVKKLWGEIAYKIPEGWRICGENMYARHSIAYDDLESYFYGFSIWTPQNVALDWDSTLMWFEELGITPVQELYRGPFDVDVIKKLTDSLDPAKVEGLVVRTTEEIFYELFEYQVAKYVRKGHVQTDAHWMHAEIIPNKLKSK